MVELLDFWRATDFKFTIVSEDDFFLDSCKAYETFDLNEYLLRNPDASSCEFSVLSNPTLNK